MSHRADHVYELYKSSQFTAHLKQVRSQSGRLGGKKKEEREKERADHCAIQSVSVAARTNIKINSLWPTHVLESQVASGKWQDGKMAARLKYSRCQLHSVRTWTTFRLDFVQVLRMSCHLFAFSIYFFIPLAAESAALEFGNH